MENETVTFVVREGLDSTEKARVVRTFVNGEHRENAERFVREEGIPGAKYHLCSGREVSALLVRLSGKK